MIAHISAIHTPPAAPSGLKAAGREYWASVTGEFDISPTDQVTLKLACVQLDRAAAAAKNIRRNGMFTTDRFGQQQENPAAIAERAAMNSFRLLQRELALSAEPPDNRPLTSPRGYR